MALSLTSGPAKSGGIFPEDDEEIWKTIVSVPSSDETDTKALSPLLSGLTKRLQEDWQTPSVGNDQESEQELYWKSLCKNVTKATNGKFSYLDAASQTISGASTKSSEPPAAFETAEGKKHLEATQALLALSKDRAIQITMGALRSVDTDSSNDNFSSLLGTRELLTKTMVYHHRQRSARLSVLAESLRLEQDPSYPNRAVLQSALLDPLEETYSNANQHKRGLFKSLLIASCMPDPVAQRSVLEPAKALRATAATTGNSSLFASEIFSELVAQTKRERTQAMEGLLALLYQRLDGSMHRCDYVLLLTAFFSNTGFSRDLPWEHLGGLICAESTTLWKAFESSSSRGWTEDHPLLKDIRDKQGLEEVESVVLLLIEIASSSIDSRPQSLGLLSFGLLLCLAADDLQALTQTVPSLPNGSLSERLFGIQEKSSPKVYSLKEYGAQLVNIANDSAGAFEYLAETMKNLTGDALSDPPSLVVHDALYDWQFSQRSKASTPPLLMLTETSEAMEGDGRCTLSPSTQKLISADIVAYTSIAREILGASIATFSDTLLSIDREDSCQNIGMLCKLAAVIYKNNEPLCTQFWDSWEAYVSKPSSSEGREGFPMCQLLDASYNLSREYLAGWLQGLQGGKTSIQREDLLSAVGSFLLFLSVLCYNKPETAESTIEMLPTAMIPTALECCCADPLQSGPDALEHRRSVLESLERLTRTATSSPSCRSRIRVALEGVETKECASWKGPRILVSLLESSKNATIARSVLGTIGNLLEGAPKEWAKLMAIQFIDSNGGSKSATSRLIPYLSTNDESLTHSAVLVLAELIGHMSTFVFCTDDEESTAAATVSARQSLFFLQSLGEALLAAMTGLSTTRISTASVETAEMVFQSWCNFLKWIRPILKLHESKILRQGSLFIRDTLIDALANSNGIGESLVYYATAPVSLGILVKLEEIILDQSIAEQVAKEDETEASKEYGAWASFTSGYKGHSSGHNLSKAKALEFLAKMTPSDFDLEGVQSRGWVNGSNPNGIATLYAAWSSIRLLSEWASHVEDIAKSHIHDKRSDLNEEAKQLLKQLSPQRLLCTAAPTPIPAQGDTRLSSLWQSMEASTLDLLLPYLTFQKAGKDHSLSISIVLNLLNACISHAAITEAKMADSLVLRTIVQSTRFSSLLQDIVEKGIDSAENGNFDESFSTTKHALLDTFVGLQVLSSCVSASPAVANVMLGLEKDSGLVKCLVEGALFASKVLDLNGSEAIFSTPQSILQMRIAAGCASILSEMWKTVGFLSTASPEDSVASSLRKAIDGHSDFLSALSKLVSNYANSTNLEDRINISHETEFARVSTMSFLTYALKILSNAHVYETCKEDSKGTGSTSNILSNFEKCRCFLRAETYALSATSTKQIWDFAQYAGLEPKFDPFSLLSSFPATSSYLRSTDFYRNENSFDLSSLSQWLASIGSFDGFDSGDDDFSMNDALDKASLLHHSTVSQMGLMESWKKFLEIVVFQEYISNEFVLKGSNMLVVKHMTHDTIYSLHKNLSLGAASQTGFLTEFMREEICEMSNSLSDLFLFQLEIGAFDDLDLDELLEVARLLSNAMKSLQDVTCPDPAQIIDGRKEHLQEYCNQQQTLLSCALVVCGLIEKREHSRPDQGKQGEIYTSLCLTNCTFLQAFSRLCTEDTISSKMNRTIIRSIASLLTLLIIGYMGDQSSDSSYTITISRAFREYEVLKLLMQYASYLSAFVANSLSSANNLNPSDEEIEILETIKAVFNLIYAVADTNSPDMIRTLHLVELSELAVRNPLFKLRYQLWSQLDQSQVQPRGYVFKREMVTLSNQKSSIYVGSEDPIYEIWLASMQVLGACVRTSSHYLSNAGSGVEGPSADFLGMSIEFLKVFKAPLLICLKSCIHPSKMTRFAVHEAKVLLSMVAELCKRNVRSSLMNSNLELCDEFVEHTKILVASLSKFLGASGTSSELFAAIEEYETSDQDGFEEQQKCAPLSRLRKSLLSIGLPMAKQKAMRLSNYASSRLEKISQVDFEGATVVPNHLKSLSEKRAYESESERICRLAVTNQFSLDLVRASAECVCQALSLMLRTHAMSKSFYMFSEADKAIDVMSLVEPGIVIGYWPNSGRSMLFDSKGFEPLRFGRVLSVDTFSRTWEVEVIRQEERNPDVLNGRKESVRAAQLAGIEDKSARRPSTSLTSPAPDTMSAFESAPGFLTIGNYIMILRWCHQQSTLAQGNTSLDAGFHTPSYLRQIAEQASILLGADLVLHGLNGSFQNKDPKELSQLDSQLFELFADKKISSKVENLENQEPTISIVEGRLHEIVDFEIWDGLQSQAAPFLQRAWKVQQEVERKRREKQRNAGSGTEFFSGFRRAGKSSFRR